MKPGKARTVLLGIFLGGLVLLAASFGGALHPLGDSLAVFRHWLAILIALSGVLLLKGCLRLAIGGGLVAFLAAAPVLAGWFAPKEGGGKYGFYQKNLLYDGTNRPGILRDILDSGADFVTLEEISDANMEIVRGLGETYPSLVICQATPWERVAALSRYPVIAGSPTCLGNQGAAAMQVRSPDGPVWLVALHLHWPWPRPQSRQVARLAPALQALDGPVLLGGDFNMVPWSQTMREIQKATGSRRAGAVLFTFRHPRYPLWLPIDHILVPGGRGWLETRPFLGSDHRGLLLHFDLKPAPQG